MQNTASIVKCIYEDEGGGGGGVRERREGSLEGDVMKRQQAAKWMGPARRGAAGSVPPFVQCNGQSSCERRSPLFPTTQQWGKTVPRVYQGQVTLLIYTLGLCMRTMHTHNSFIWCVHTDRPSLMCTHSHLQTGETGRAARKDPDSNFGHFGAIV